MKKLIKIGILASSFLAANAVTVSTVAASSITQAPRVARVTKVQTENPLLRKYATVTPPDGGAGRGCGMDWDTGGRGGHWWG